MLAMNREYKLSHEEQLRDTLKGGEKWNEPFLNQKKRAYLLLGLLRNS
jgi:hypothetical protein